MPHGTDIVTPCEGVGVEIVVAIKYSEIKKVTPCEGVGVEIQVVTQKVEQVKSRLARAWE